MTLSPVPLTTDPEDEASPKGAIPVSIFGVEGDTDSALPELPPEDQNTYVLTVTDGELAWVEAGNL